MANHKSAIKRIRQDRKKRLRNKSYKSYIKTVTKKFMREKDPVKKEELLKTLYSVLDRAVTKGILHKNTVARRKRRAALLLRVVKEGTKES